MNSPVHVPCVHCLATVRIDYLRPHLLSHRLPPRDVLAILRGYLMGKR